MSVYYLAHDPAACVKELPDATLRSAPYAAATVLAGVWDAMHSPFRGHIDHPSKHAHLLTWHVAPARGAGQAAPSPAPDPYWAALERDRSFWTLLGQRIAVPPLPHPLTDWARQGTGNYAWVLGYGTEAIFEFKRRFNKLAPLAGMLWPMEFAPPGLPEGDQTEPAPVGVSESHVVIEDGYYNTIACYRNALIGRTLGPTWTKARRPDWWKEDPTLKP